jgi:hypothetical protein
MFRLDFCPPEGSQPSPHCRGEEPTKDGGHVVSRDGSTDLHANQCYASYFLTKKISQMKFRNVVSQKKTRTLGIRLSDAEIERFAAFAAESRIPLAEMFRLLMDAAIECFAENDGWPREIAVVKKSRSGAGEDIQPATTLPALGTHAVKGETRSFSPTPAYAASRTATKRTPRAQHPAKSFG